MTPLFLYIFSLCEIVPLIMGGHTAPYLPMGKKKVDVLIDRAMPPCRGRCPRHGGIALSINTSEHLRRSNARHTPLFDECMTVYGGELICQVSDPLTRQVLAYSLQIPDILPDGCPLEPSLRTNAQAQPPPPPPPTNILLQSTLELIFFCSYMVL